MTVALIGTKSGMTNTFIDGRLVPVTVISVQPNFVSQVKSVETDGYKAAQLATGFNRKANKAIAGHYKKNNIEACKISKEIRLDNDTNYEVGQELGVSLFEGVQYVDVSGVSKGSGFAGTIKRWNFAGQNMTHGNSKAHRKPGSTGQCQDPGRVFKGKKMAGQLGNVNVTIQNLELVAVDSELSCLMVKGAIPGPKNGTVMVRLAKKRRGA